MVGIFSHMQAGMLLLILNTFVLMAGCAGGASSYKVKSPSGTTTTFILVRHAEKQNQDEDSPLSVQGRERALDLVNAVTPFGISAIYCTHPRRNTETVKPLSKQLGIEVRVLRKRAPFNTSQLVDQFVRESLSQHGGGVILWVGNSSHLGDWASNLQQIYQRLGGTGRGPHRYDDLFIMTVSDSGGVDIQRKRYGSPAD